MKKFFWLVGLLVVLFFSISECQAPVLNSIEPSKIPARSQSYTVHAPMVISSNADFITEGWIGDGSSGTPYTIEWLEFISALNDACISISDTSAHFRIQNCLFAPSTFADAIRMDNVANGEIKDSITFMNATTIYALASHDVTITSLTLYGTCIIMEQSWQCTISNCIVQTAPGDGVSLLDCSQMTVESSAFISNIASGISIDGTSDTTISGNFVQGNDLEQIFIYGASYNNRIYNNIIYLGSQGVRDDGSGNFWDDSVSIGNWWSNYAGSGVYDIPGNAGSVDRYPRGGGSPTFIPITYSTTDSTTTPISSIPPGGLVITTWVPLNLPTKAALILIVALSYGILVILAIKKLR